MSDLSSLTDSIKKYLSKYYVTYIDITDVESATNINNLFNNNNYNEPSNDIECIYFGWFFKIMRKYDLTEKYYLMAIENGNHIAMFNLGYYYHHELPKLNSELAEKYYLMSMENGNNRAANQLGHYYGDMKNYELMEKYYLMAIDGDERSEIATTELELYYKKINNVKSLLKLYYKLNDKNKIISTISKLLKETSNEYTEDITDILLNIDLSDIKDCPIHITLLQKLLREKIDIMGISI